MYKQIIYNFIEKGENGSKLNITFDYFIILLILSNVLTSILETIHEINRPLKETFRIFEIISIVIFTLEYILRLYISDLTHPSNNRIRSFFKFILSGSGLIDLLAIIPFYIPFLIQMDLRFLRILRLTKFIRILKVNRYNNSASIILEVIKEKKEELTITGFITFLTLLFASFLMYHIEGQAQPDHFPNVIASFWWAVATLTTVGYGDVYPITAIGKFISGFIAILGIGIVALPTGIISAGFMERINKKKISSTTCPHCGQDLCNINVSDQMNSKVKENRKLDKSFIS